jgi:nitric oxide dioxygenase
MSATASSTPPERPPRLKQHHMTSDQVTLVQQSFAQVAPIADKAAEIFYERLFDIAPSVKPLFHGDMAEQRRKLMATLAVVVNGLSDLPSILPAASALAKRHVGYGARPEHYSVVGEALLWTLARGLGPKWTPDVAGAWTAAYGTLSAYMIQEAFGPPATAHSSL